MKDREVAILAGGCFWCLEAVFEQLKGVEQVESGYSGGTVDDPSYQQVCSGTTGHAEAVKVLYDPRHVSYEELVRTFFALHDPTTLNRQGPDVGTQYRLAIFTASEDQAKIARAVVEELTKADAFRSRPIVTIIEPAGTFWPAEDYHQDYHAKHGGSCIVPDQ